MYFHANSYFISGEFGLLCCGSGGLDSDRTLSKTSLKVMTENLTLYILDLVTWASGSAISAYKLNSLTIAF